MPVNEDFSFDVRVGEGQIVLEEYQDANSEAIYIAMPMNSPELTYEVEFREELPDGEVIIQMWPVAPYEVHAQNNSDTTVFAYLHVDGQQVAQTCIDAHSEGTFTGAALPSNRYELKELLFSLPRFVTQAEKKRAGGKALTEEQIAALGTIRVSFHEATFTHKGWANGFTAADDFTQGNKTDAALGAAGAATTRLGKTIATTETRRRMTEFYDCADTGTDITVRYRTRHYLVDIGIIPDPDAAARKAARDRKRAAKRLRNSAQQSNSLGGSSAVGNVPKQLVVGAKSEPIAAAPPAAAKRQRSSSIAIVID